MYSSLVGRLAAVGRRSDGAPVLRSPFHGLDGLTAAPGLVATVSVLLGSTAFDGLSNTSWWINLTQTSSLPVTTLLAVILAVGALYGLAAWLSGELGGPSRRTLAGVFARIPSRRSRWAT